MKEKIKILCVPSDKYGCGLHRSLIPHLKLGELFKNEFEITIYYDFNWDNLDYINQFDIIHYHKGDYNNMDSFYKALDFCKENNIVTIMDIDDYWKLPQEHPLFGIYKSYNISSKLINNLTKSDYVTTTTSLFAKEIKKYNKNIKVYPNAIDKNYINKLKNNINNTNKIRIGFVMGSSHENDMELVRGMCSKLSSDILNKIQIVLCGFDTRGTITEIFENGETKSRNILPHESVWCRFEENVTNNYQIVNEEYKDFLQKYIPNIEYPNVNNEGYRRCWTKPVDDYQYMEHYNNLDILLVPLQSTDFNEKKSELKFVEAGMMNVAVIASNFGPYTIGSENFFQKGGIINKNGNCVLIDNKKAHKDWAKMIEKLVKNPEYIDLLKNNMAKHVEENYNLEKITAERAEWYKKICKRNGKEE